MQNGINHKFIQQSRSRNILFIVVGILFLSWLIFAPEGILGKADAIGYAVCHRIPSHSFVIGERPFPLCARCSGMYLGAIIGLIYQSFISWKASFMPPRRVIIILGIFVLFFAFDGINSFLSLIPFTPTIYSPQNMIRLLSGTGMGIVIAALIYPAFHQTVWRESVKKPAISGIKILFGLIGILLILDFVIIHGSTLVLYPLALLSSTGVLILLTIIYTILWLILLKSENRYNSLSELTLPATAGFGTAILQVIVLSVIRYTLTGTWDGFNFF